MLLTDDRNQIRRYFCEVWRKQSAGQLLEPLESLIAEVILQHPEYQGVLANPEEALARDYLPERGEINPFLHMGMHIAVREQVATDLPVGIVAVYRLLCQRYGDSHVAEHRMMECLGETLWEAQRSGTVPAETVYLTRLRRLAGQDLG